MVVRLTHVALFVLCAGSATPQEYRKETVESAGIEVQVHKKLKAIPIELGKEDTVFDLHRRARFDPESLQARIMKGPQPFLWGMDVYVFEDEKQYSDTPTDQAEIRRRAVEKRKFDAGARNFEQFIKSKDPRSATTQYHGRGKDSGLKVKARGSVPEHTLWEYSNADSTDDPKIDFHWYTVSANYRLEGREVAFVFTWPIFKDKPDSKYLGIGKKMVESLRVLESTPVAGGGDAGGADALDANANTPERQQRLQTAVAGIKGIDGWDYFSTPTCIVLYSWKPDSPKQKKAESFAESVADQFDALQELYREHFPPFEGMEDCYPVIRICYDLNTFRAYGRPPVGTEGFFNADSNEVVIMQGGDQDSESLVARFGWEPFAAAYFPKTKLGPWFVTGMGEFFAAFTRSGKRWSCAPSKFRIAGDNGVKSLFKRGANGSLTEIVGWNEAKFTPDEDNKEADQWIAQAYSLVDFLKRGKKLGAKWNDAWDAILPGYIDSLKTTRNASRANKAAFDPVDAGAFDAAWKAWVESHIHKK